MRGCSPGETQHRNPKAAQFRSREPYFPGLCSPSEDHDTQSLLRKEMFVTIRRYSPKNGAITKASLDLLRRQIHDQFIPTAQGIPGFCGYYVINVDNRELITLSIYETLDGSKECTRCSAEYTLRNPLIYELGRPEVTEGEILTSAHAQADGAGEAAATALALWYEESRAMLLSASER
jgi:hypothetical protein